MYFPDQANCTVLADHTSQDEARTVITSSETSRIDPYTTELYHPSRLGGHVFGVDSEMMQLVNTASIDPQVEWQPLTQDDFDTDFDITQPFPRPNSLLRPSRNIDAYRSKPTATALCVPEQSQYQQLRATNEQIYPSMIESAVNCGRSQFGFKNEGNSFKPAADPSNSQATRCSDYGHTMGDLSWPASQEDSLEMRSRGPQLSSRENPQDQRMKESANNKCPMCDQTFKRRDNIKPHVRNKHPGHYRSLYAMSRSPPTQPCPAPLDATSTQPCPAPDIHQAPALDEALATQDVGRDGIMPLAHFRALEQEGKMPGPVQSDVGFPSGNTVPQKRSISMASLGNPAISDSSQKRSVPRLINDGNDAGRPFACPFLKRSPSQHQRCLSLLLHRIKDVKQHIFRCHTQPAYYCASCFEVFDTANDRDEHSRRRECEKLEGPCLPQFEGITEDQRKQLSGKSLRTMSVEDQWFKIWSVVFPDVSSPRSAYLGDFFEEMVPLLREKWEYQRSSIMEQAVKEGSQQLDCSINWAMKIFLDSLEGETAD